MLRGLYLRLENGCGQAVDGTPCQRCDDVNATAVQPQR